MHLARYSTALTNSNGDIGSLCLTSVLQSKNPKGLLFTIMEHFMEEMHCMIHWKIVLENQEHSAEFLRNASIENHMALSCLPSYYRTYSLLIVMVDRGVHISVQFGFCFLKLVN